MAGKKSTKNTLKESISLNVSAQQFYGYADYYNRVPLFPVLQLTNAGAEAAEGLEVTIEGSDGFLLPFAKQLEEVPFESTVEIAAQIRDSRNSEMNRSPKVMSWKISRMNCGMM